MPKGYWPGRNWTPEMLAQVDKYLSQGRTDTWIGKRLGRTATAVQGARERYGLVVRTKQTNTSAKVARLLGVRCSKTVVWWIREGWLRGRRAGDVWHISDDALQAFLEDRRYWHLWDVERVTDRDWRDWARELRAGDRFLTTREAGDRIGVQHETVNNWIHRGLLPAVRRGNWLIREADLVGFVAPIDRVPTPLPVAENWPTETFGRFTIYRQPAQELVHA